MLCCVALAFWVDMFSIDTEEMLALSFKGQQRGSPLACALASSSCCGNSDLDCQQLRKLMVFLHFKLLPLQGISHFLDSPYGVAAPTQKFFPARIFWLFIFVQDLWRPISTFGVAVQTCLGGMWPTAGTWGFVQLSPRLSDLLHTLRLAETQQLLYLMGEQGFPGIGWETQNQVWQP